MVEQVLVADAVQLVGLRVTDPVGARAVADLAERLATTAAARVRAAGLP